MSQVVSGGNQVQYELNFYVNGLPKDFVTWSTGYKFSEIQINNVYVPINFSISGVSGNVVGSDVEYLFNGLVETKPYYLLVSSESNSMNISASYTIDAATSTGLEATDISISFALQSKNIDPNVQRYYVILDVSYPSVNPDIKVMKYSDGYRFIIKTDMEKFVTVTDETGKAYKLFTKRLPSSDKPQCVFVAERGKRYNIKDDETSKLFGPFSASTDQTKEEEIVDLTKL
ncbi:MAG TPA: hypothetical protein PK258_05480 [Fervidobacterium sp.]|nr:hypothetical protein [Fervidobacterium sp.]HOS51847.1 hypothetical protein [Fervidobacterium sp.]HPC79700.1 hypothetical protein [Fervidobacterium sp.]HRT01787.1 hypothetical protein [Fervidobacterium sp.]HRV37249.1 hypothetical protein [Fervidobacterium sp.]